MIVQVNVESLSPRNLTTLNLAIAVAGIRDDGSRFAFSSDVDVARSSSATQINTAIKNVVIAKSAEFNASNIPASDIFVFGAA